MKEIFGPTLPISQEIDAEKYRQPGETFSESVTRLARITEKQWFVPTLEMLLQQRFLPAGRVRAAIGSERDVTAFNCFVMPLVGDSMESIMDVLKHAALTMKRGGGVGYDFSALRPRGATITTLDSASSGPISFMEIYNAMCGTISSAGHRRGAQMGVLRVDHPDIEEFIEAKTTPGRLTNFNISVAVTDEFMQAVKQDRSFDLTFQGKTYKTVQARDLWDKLMRATWDWAEPGVLFIDRINHSNNLWYCEEIRATNPCGEQPLPANGACLLGSHNLVKYVKDLPDDDEDFPYRALVAGGRWFDVYAFEQDVALAVRLLDNVIDHTGYPHPEQEQEAKDKRRMGIGVTGLANAGEALGYPYGSPEFLAWADEVFRTLRDAAYNASCELAGEKGAFPAFDADLYGDGQFIATLPADLQAKIYHMGIRNSHLISFAPTGTISLSADNVSSGIEPVFSYGYDRTINMPDGTRVERVDDYGVRAFGVKGKTADQLTPKEHVDVQALAQKYCDSAVSKTCNIGADVTFEEFKQVYMYAYDQGAKGCTTFRASGKRMGVLVADAVVPTKEEMLTDLYPWAQPIEEGAACTYDLTTGQKSCG